LLSGICPPPCSTGCNARALDLNHAKDLIIDDGVKLALFPPLVLGGAAAWLLPRRPIAGAVQPVAMLVLGIAAWVIADAGSETRQGLAVLVGMGVSIGAILMLDKISVRFWSPERRALAHRPNDAWIGGAAIAVAAVAALAIWVALPALAPERGALVWTLSHGVPLVAGVWGLVVLARVGWQAFLAVGEG
jgi:hypothetical protein